MSLSLNDAWALLKRSDIELQRWTRDGPKGVPFRFKIQESTRGRSIAFVRHGEVVKPASFERFSKFYRMWKNGIRAPEAFRNEGEEETVAQVIYFLMPVFDWLDRQGFVDSDDPSKSVRQRRDTSRQSLRPERTPKSIDDVFSTQGELLLDRAVYTIVAGDRIEACIAKDAVLTLQLPSTCATIQSLYAEASSSDKWVPVLLGDARTIVGVEWWGVVDSIEKHSKKLMVTLASVRSVGAAHPLHTLRKLSDGRPLSDKYLRNYVPVHTPRFVIENANESPFLAETEPPDEPSGGAVQGLSVDDAVRMALATDPSLRGESATVRKALIDARLGQGRFRQELLRYWGGCSVTGCSLVEVLVASHIVPWHTANNSERLNVHNGLLLTATLDRLFDAHLISFNDRGDLLVSDYIGGELRRSLGLDGRLRLRRLEEEHVAFLRRHREAFEHRRRDHPSFERKVERPDCILHCGRR